MPVPPVALWQLLTPAGVPGGIAVIGVHGDVDAALGRLAIAPVPVGAVAVRDLCGVDRGVVARWSETSAHLMPHGGVAIVRMLAEALTARGIEEQVSADPRVAYSEAADEVEAHMLAALARAASPVAIDILLDQPRRWREGSEPDAGLAERSRVLNRLLEPPLVVGVGPANVGKSTLVNELAGRCVAVVADEPGTTRDHVGVTLDLGGVVVRYVDTPGLRGEAGASEREAARLALELVERADLVLVFADATASLDVMPASGHILRVGLRSDLGPARGATDVRVSVRQGTGLAELVTTMREALVPQGVLEHPGPWKFW